MAPGVDAIPVRITDHRLDGRALDLHCPPGRHADLQVFVQYDQIAREMVFRPKLPGRQGFRRVLLDSEFEHVPDIQSLHCHVLLTQIAVERCLARDLRGHVLHIFRRGLYQRPIRLANAHIPDLEGSSRTGI